MNSEQAAARGTVTAYLLRRLDSLGVRHVFGVPGDYNLAMLDQILEYPGIEWVGTANELNAAYAADGYSRVNGFAALLTTMGVGELSAINGVAGSFAERVPLVHVAVGPTTVVQQAGALVHHTAGDGDFDRFAQAYTTVTSAQAVITADNAAAEIDRVLTTAIRESRPVYLRIAADTANTVIDLPTEPLQVSLVDDVDRDALQAFLEAADDLLAKAHHVTVLADVLVDRFDAGEELEDLLNISQFPVATLSMGKSVVDESNPRFLGTYNGAFSDAGLRAAVDDTDLLIRAGLMLVDTNTGLFSHGFDPNQGIELNPYSAGVDGRHFERVPMKLALAGLTKLIVDREQPKQPTPQTVLPVAPPAADEPLNQVYLWDAVAETVRSETTVVAETGTSYYGMSTRRLPTGARFIGQPLWASIGYTLPALLGATLADPSRRGLLLIGDGSAQMTIQELGTLPRHGINPIILLVNNSGYTVERAIHGERATYNDIATWDWSAVPAALGAPDALVLRADTNGELTNALRRAVDTQHRMVFIEARTGIDDVPDLLARITRGLRNRNQT